MRGKALTLALLLFASALAGCIREDTEDPIDRTGDDLDLDDVADIIDDLESCEDAGGTWIEVQNRPIDGFCDMGEDEDDREDEWEISQEDCERRNGAWTEAPDREGEFYCDFDGNDGNNTSNSFPVITIEGDEELQLNASETEEYVDVGATCLDEEDGDLTNVTEVTGQVVDMNRPDTYEIIYTCEDSDGNSVQMTRLVTILEVDTDGDGVPDDDDAFPDDASETTDSDGDGVGANADAFPNDANETVDSDGDGVGDNADQCDDTESGVTVGDDGCVDNEAHEHFIDISGMAFSESTITISIGDIITWTNQDSAPHSATADNGEFDSGALNNGESFTFIFNTTGTYTYHCSIHNGMTATIIVE